ncbi:hypothetical protein [Bradyrhizobium sp.]|uniref:hypothetical protein n=1 Tax=Bradyrhizobium sp. TaxID=376 RepID=UPI0025C17CCB|nr:hypothetical protein [Bradyrhizobium sp.]
MERLYPLPPHERFDMPAVRRSFRVGESTLNELDAAIGGMNYTPGTKTDNVIDTRGGQDNILWFTITKDTDGKSAASREARADISQRTH